MDREPSQQLLNILIENSNRILNAGFGLDHAEPTFFQIVKILKNDDRMKAVFLNKVEQTLSYNSPAIANNSIKDSASTELIELVAYEFKWPEIKELAEGRIHRKFGDNREVAIGDPAWHILNIFNGDWPCRQFYTKYNKS